MTAHQKIKEFPQKKLWNHLAIMVLGVGVLLRIIVWWQQRSIFLDEANLIRNWVEKSNLEMWGHLDYAQYAPPLYSMLNKLIILLFGNSELSVRIVPLFFGLGALILFYKIGKRILSPLSLFLSSIFISWGHIFLQYSTECKQYSSDSFVALALVYLALEEENKGFTWKKAFKWFIFGSASIWFSMPAIFVLGGIGLFFLLKNKSEKAAAFKMILTGLLWVIQFALYFFLLLKSEAQSDNLQNFHASYFLSFPPASFPELENLGVQLADIATLAIGPTVVAMILVSTSLLAAFYVFKKNAKLLILFGLPILLTLIASAIGYYSLIGRLILFFIPLLIFLIFIGIDVLFSFEKKWLSVVILLLFLIPIINKQQLSAFYKTFHTDYATVKIGLLHAKENFQSGDVLFAYHNIAPVVRYYQYHHDKPISFAKSELQNYRCCDSDIIEQDINKLREQGEKRIWIIYDVPDFDFIRAFIKTEGGNIESEKPFYRGGVFLAVFP